jgi:MFS family permease
LAAEWSNLQSVPSDPSRPRLSGFKVDGSTGIGARAGFVALLAADTVSALGSFVSIVALPWLVLVNTGSPARMGLIAAAEMVPYVVSCVFGTPLADRIGLKVSSVVADGGSALAMALVAAVPRQGFLSLVGLVALAGALRGIGDRTKHVLLRPMAAAAGVAMIRVTGTYETLNKGAQLVGAPLGGLLIYWFGAGGAIWLDAASFAVCCLLVAGLVYPPRSGKPVASEGYLAALVAGVRQLLDDPVLMAMTACYFALNVLTQAGTAIFIPLWIAELVRTPAALGLVTGAFAVGAVLGGFAFTIIAPGVPRRWAFVIGVTVGSAPRLFVLGLSHSLTVVLVVTFVTGVLSASANPVLGAALYERVPANLQSRVFGLVAAICLAGLPVGGMLAGWTATNLNLTAAILLAACLSLAMTVATAAWYLRAETASA